MSQALHVLGRLDPGGVERWLRDTVRYRTGSRWRFDFCVLGSGRGCYEAELEAYGCRILRCPLLPWATFPVRFLGTLRRRRFDVVHSHVHYFSGVILALARAAGVPVRIAHSHTYLESRSPSCVRRGYQAAARFLLTRAMTAGMACSGDAAKFAGPSLASRFRILPCGIDLGAFRHPPPDRNGLRRRIGVPADACLVGNVGRLAVEKNQAFLIQAFYCLLRQIPRAHLLIVGGGPLQSNLEALARSLGIDEHVTFTGPRADVADLLHACDTFALPSLREGLPAAILEAQAAGVPSVVSIRIPQEALVDSDLVERLEVSSAEQWAAALGRASLRSRGHPADLCRRLRDRGFDVADSFGALARMYEELLDDSRQRTTEKNPYGIAPCRRSSPQP